MAIKSYTDLEQSKKLAEILPIESADMCLTFVNNIWNPVWGKANDIYQLQKDCYEPDYTKDDYVDIDEFEPKVVPCWSLTALINIIPQEIFDGEYIVNITEGRDNKWIITYDHYEHSNHSYYGLSAGADNLVDACTDIIIKLKERNII